MSAIFGGPLVPGSSVTTAQISDATANGRTLITLTNYAAMLSALGGLPKTLAADTTLNTGAFTLSIAGTFSLGGTWNWSSNSVWKIGGNLPTGDSFVVVLADGTPAFFDFSSYIFLTADTGWTANADAGTKTAVIPSTATIAGLVTALNLVSPQLGTILAATAEKVKALEDALVNSLVPNA